MYIYAIYKKKPTKKLKFFFRNPKHYIITLKYAILLVVMEYSLIFSFFFKKKKRISNNMLYKTKQKNSPILVDKN